MTDIFRLADDLGPAKIIHVYQPTLGLKGILVVDNVATGPPSASATRCAGVRADRCDTCNHVCGCAPALSRHAPGPV